MAASRRPPRPATPACGRQPGCWRLGGRLACGLLLASLLLAGPVRAEEPEVRARAFGLRDTSEGRHAIDEVTRLHAAGDLAGALRMAQAGLERHAEDTYLEEQALASERWRPVGQVLEAWLLGLAPGQRERYDALCDPSVEPLLAAARARGDTAPLEEVRRRFRASRHGLEATRLLLERAMEAGDLRRVARLAEEVTARAPQDAAAWWRWMEALATLGEGEALARLQPPEGLVLATARGPMALDTRLAGLRDAAAATPAGAPASEAWPTWGGAPHRLASVPPGGRTLGLRWSLDSALAPREHDLPGREMEGDDQVDFVAALAGSFPLFPASDGRVLYVGDGRSLRAIDLYGGRLLWALERAQPGLPLVDPRGWLRGRSAIDRPFAPSLWRDRVIGTVEVQVDWVEERVLGTQTNFYMPRRSVVAVARDSGALLWRMGTQGLDRERLRNVHVCGEPVVVDDTVVAVASRNTGYEQVMMIGLEAATGRLRWERPLAYGQQETNLFGNPVKEFSAGAVSAREGVAYASTGLGCLCAVRVQDGALQWLASYDNIPIQPVQAWYQPRIRVPLAGPTAPLVTPALVVVAPGDARHVSAYERASGRLRWRVGLEEGVRAGYGVLRHVLGVAPVGGREAVLVTGGSVQALDLETGRLLARGRLEGNDARVLGQGIVRGREVLVPTSLGVQRFSLDGELKLVGTDPWPEGAVPGNLLALGSVLVVAGRGPLQAHYAWEEVERELARRRREHPGDAAVLLEAADLYLRGRGPGEARAAFRAALEVAEPGSALAERARRGLFDAWMAEGRARAGEDPVRGAPAWREALQAAATPAERVEARLALDLALAARHEERIENLERLYDEAGDEVTRLDGMDTGVPVRVLALLRIARAEEAARRAPAAVAALQRLLEAHGDELVAAERASALAHRRIAALVERFGPAAYAAQEASAREALAAARASGDATRLSRVLATWPNAAVVPEARLALGRALLEAGEPQRALVPLQDLRAETPEAPEAREGLVALRQALGALGAKGAERAVEAAQAGEDLPAVPEAAGGRLLLPLHLVQAEARGDEDVVLPLPVACEDGEVAPLALTSRGGTLRAYSLASGRLAFERAEAHASRAAWCEGTLVAALRGTLQGLDPATGEARWTQERMRSLHDLAVGRGTVVVLGQAPAEDGGARVLEAHDATTGLLLWSTALGQEPVFQLQVAGLQVLLSRQVQQAGGARTRTLVFDLLCGALRATLDPPVAMDLREVVLPGRIVHAGPPSSGTGRLVTCTRLPAGTPAWSALLEDNGPVTALLPHRDELWVLQHGGALTRLSLATGEVRSRTKVATGQAHARPAFGTSLCVHDGLLVVMALGARGASPLLAFDPQTGKLRWEVEGSPLAQSQQHALLAVGPHLVALWAGEDANRVRQARLKVVRAADGSVEQEVEQVLSGPHGVVAVSAGPAALLLVADGGAATYGPTSPAR
ncbi:MAG: PQQ-binding-like beta-propeller repeat protein [Planctomycetia bacterium]